MQKRNILNSPRLLELKKKRRKIFVNKIFLSVSGFLVLFAGLVYLSRLDKLNIGEVRITGNKLIDAGEIKSAAQEELEGNYLWVFPRTNIFFYPKKGIKNKLTEKFPRLKNAAFLLEDRKTLEISITERLALYTWCGDAPPNPGGEEKPACNFLDETGFLFDEAPYFSGEVYFKFYGANFSAVDFNRLVSFKKAFEAMRLKPAALYADRSGDVRIFLAPKSSASTGPEIIFKIDSDLEKMIANLKTALDTEPMRTNFRNKYSSLEYIDLRFGNKVYYKFN